MPGFDNIPQFFGEYTTLDLSSFSQDDIEQMGQVFQAFAAGEIPDVSGLSKYQAQVVQNVLTHMMTNGQIDQSIVTNAVNALRHIILSN